MKYFTLLITLSALLFSYSCNDNAKNKAEAAPTNEDPVIIELSKNITSNEKDHLSIAKRGYTYYEQNRFELAEADFKKAIELAPDVLDYQNLLSDLYYDFDQTDASIKVLANIIKQYPAHKETLYKKAEIEIVENKYQEAKKTLNQLLKVDANDANYYFLSGLNENKNNPTIAINHFEKCASIDPNFVDAYVELGRLYLTNDPSKVNAVIDKATAIDSLNSEAYFIKAEAYYNNKEYPTAKALYRKIIQIDPQFVDAYMNLGILQFEEGQNEKALKNFEIVNKIEPIYASAYYYAGLCHENLANITTAISYQQQALKLDDQFSLSAEALERLQSM